MNDAPQIIAAALPTPWVLTDESLDTLSGICFAHGPNFGPPPCPGCYPRRRRAPRDPQGPTAIAEFCLRVATKRFQRVQSAETGGIVSDGRAAWAATRRFLSHEESRPAHEKAAPIFSGKEKSALAKSPEEYAKWLQKLPDRVAAIVAKTCAVKGDAFELEDDTALIQIMDELNRGDHTLIERNANKKLARGKS